MKTLFLKRKCQVQGLRSNEKAQFTFVNEHFSLQA